MDINNLTDKQVIELVVNSRDLRRWTRMASTLCFNLSEYIRACTNAHTTILEYDSFGIVPGPLNNDIDTEKT